MADEPPRGEPDLSQGSVLTGQIISALNKLPEGRRQEITSLIVEASYHRGPLPSPDVFAGYEAVLPGSAREIMNMAVRQQQHEITMRERALGSEISYRSLTLGAATFVIVSMMVGAVIMALHGHEWPAAVLGGASGLSIIAGAFLKGRDLFPAKPAPSKQPAVQPSGRRPKAKTLR